jgi:hypothetical protein
MGLLLEPKHLNMTLPFTKVSRKVINLHKELLLLQYYLFGDKKETKI